MVEARRTRAVDFPLEGVFCTGQNTPSEKLDDLSTRGILSEEDPMKTALRRELEITLESALMLSPDTPIPTLAARIYDNDRALIEQFQRDWIIERLTWMMYRRRQVSRNQDQMILPGFESLPRRLNMTDGKRVPLRRANLESLAEYRKVLLARRDRRLETLDRLIDLVRQYSKKKKDPGITVAEVFALEAENEGNA